MGKRAWAVMALLVMACGPHEEVTPMITVQPGAPARAMALMGRTGANERRPAPPGAAVDAGDEGRDEADDDDEADEEPRLVFACMESFGAVGALARLPCVATLAPVGGGGNSGAPTEVTALDGKVAVAVAPGLYRVTVAHDPDYVAAHFDVTVAEVGKTWGPNEGAVVLPRILDTHGYLVADPTPRAFGDGDVRRLVATFLTRELAKGGDLLDVWSTDDVDARAHAMADFMARLLAKNPATPVASGDARTYVRVDNATQAAPWDGKRESDLAHGLHDRRDVVLTNGPFLRVTTNGAPIGGVARTTPATRDVTVVVHVECPAGVAVDHLTVLRARNVVTPPEPITLHPAPHSSTGVRVADVTLHLRALSDDAFVVLAEGPTPARALTGAIWIDADGDGESFGRHVNDTGDAPDKMRDKKTP